MNFDVDRFLNSRLRAWDRRHLPTAPGSERLSRVPWFDSDQRKNVDATYQGGDFDYELNGMGFRYATDRQPGDHCILTLGDGISFGVGVAQQATWPQLLGAHLSARWSNRVHVANLAYPRMGSEFVAMTAHQGIEVLRPHAVIIVWPPFANMDWFKDCDTLIGFTGQYDGFANRAAFGAYKVLQTDAHALFTFVRSFVLVWAKCKRLNIPMRWALSDAVEPQQLEPYVDLSGYLGAFPRLDSGRDGQHPGVASHAVFAACVMESIPACAFSQNHGVVP